MAKVTVRISSTTRKSIKALNIELVDFMERLVIKFNDEIVRFGEEDTLMELLKFKTKRKKAMIEDEINEKNVMATLLTDDMTYDKFRNNVESMGMSVSEALRRLINRELHSIDAKARRKQKQKQAEV